MEVHPSPNSERDSILPWVVKSNLKPGLQISPEINHIDSLPISLLTKTGFHAIKLEITSF
jgi:hypothetical protein